MIILIMMMYICSDRNYNRTKWGSYETTFRNLLTRIFITDCNRKRGSLSKYDLSEVIDQIAIIKFGKKLYI